MNNQTTEMWLKNVAEDPEYWVDEKDLNEYPGIIIFEYERLRSLCYECDAYGAMHCLKDNFETILKFEVLITYAWTDTNLDEDFKKERMSLLTTENLSFGSWLSLAQNLIGYFKNTNALYNYVIDRIPLKKIYKYYSDNKIVSWRNDNIGHGFLGFKEDQSFRESISNEIIILKNLLSYENGASTCNSIGAELKNQKVFIVTQDKRKMPVCGKGLERGVPEYGIPYLQLITGNNYEEIQLFPFIYVGKNDSSGYGLFFFEKQKKDTLSMFYAYMEGKRDSKREQFFEKLRGYLKKSGVTMGRAASDRYRTRQDSRALDLSIDIKGYIRQEGIIEWLRACLGCANKGVFVLQMCRGMGKSVLSEMLSGLSGLSYKTLLEEEVNVRTYHLSRIQYAGEGDFISTIEDVWSRNSDGTIVFDRLLRIKELMYENGLTKSAALSEYLSDVHEAWKEQGYKKTLMIFDGIDEVSNDNIWDFFPSCDQLGEDIYILYTSRNPEEEEMDDSLVNHITEITELSSQKMVVGFDSPINDRVLYDYISKTDLKSITREEKSKLIERANKRMLELVILCKLVEHGRDVVEVNKPMEFVSKYLGFLKQAYGYIEYTKLVELLVILSTIGEKESLTLDAIARISSHGMVTIRLIGMMTDLSPILNIQRTTSGNTYCIANPEMSVELLNQVSPELRDEVILEMINLAMATLREIIGSNEIPDYLDGDVVLCTHITEMALFHSDGIAAMGEDRIDILEKICDLYDEDVSVDKEMFIYKIVYQYYLLANIEYGNKNSRTIDIWENYAIISRNVGMVEEAIKEFQEIAEIRKEVMGIDCNETIETLQTLADSLFISRRFSEALEIYSHAYDCLKNKTDCNDRTCLILQIGMLECMFMINQDSINLDYVRDLYINSIKRLGECDNESLDMQIIYYRLLNDRERYEEARHVYDMLKSNEDEIEKQGNRSVIRMIRDVENDNDEMLSLIEKDCKECILHDRKYSPWHLDSMLNYAIMRQKNGDKEGALKTLQEIYGVAVRKFGKKNRITIVTQEELIDVLFDKEEYTESLRLCEDLIKTYDELNYSDRYVLMQICNAIWCKHKLHDYKGAVVYAERLRELNNKMYSKQSEEWITNQKICASSMEYAGLSKCAVEAYEELLDAIMIVKGNNHVDTFEVQRNLSDLLEITDRCRDSYDMKRDLFHKELYFIGEDNQFIDYDFERLIELIYQLDLYSELIAVYRDVYEYRVSKKGYEDVDTLASLSDLATVMLEYGDKNEAASLYMKIYDLSANVLGENALETLKCLDDYAGCLLKAGLFEDAYYNQNKLVNELKVNQRGDENWLCRSIERLRKIERLCNI